MEVTDGIIVIKDFWSTVDYSLIYELVGLGLSSFVVGYGVGYKLYLFRRFAHSVT